MVLLTTTVESIRRYRQIRSTVVLPKAVEAIWGLPNARDGASDYHRQMYSMLPLNTFNGGAA